MTKRLCELFQIESNTKDCVVFTIKPDTSPLDLVKLAGFEGHESIGSFTICPFSDCEWSCSQASLVA